MADERDVSEIGLITAFFLKTCRLPPCLTKRYVQAAVSCAVMSTKVPEYEKNAVSIPLVTGSVAEFYIEPMLPHVGDIDVMYYLNTQLAIPRGHPPPTQLPAEFHNYVKVVEIIDSHLPGYVYLPERYLLTKCVDNNKYICTKYDDNETLHLSNECDYGSNVVIKHGPAVLINQSSDSILPADSVGCIRCFSWPPQAADWPTRHRNYGWPDSSTLDRVVSNGCDVVPVAHRQCRQHEVIGKFQFRLSFSRAEIVLINS